MAGRQSAAETCGALEYLLGSAYAAALELDPDGDVEAVAFRVRVALRIVERIESTCGWTDTVRAGFRDSAWTGPLGDQARDWFRCEPHVRQAGARADVVGE